MRRDRIDVIHGGFCTYIKKGLKYTILEDLHDDKIEAIWLHLRPSRLPRGLSCIIIANVYHPQTDKGVSDSEILLYLHDSMSTIESRFSNCGVLIMGDFNRIDTLSIRNAFKLKQIVKFHTRGNQTLDLVLTNIKEFYEEPIKRPVSVCQIMHLLNSSPCLAVNHNHQNDLSLQETSGKVTGSLWVHTWKKSTSPTL